MPAVATSLGEDVVPLAASLRVCRLQSERKETPFIFVIRVASQSSSC